MCGIAGILDPDGAAARADDLQGMLRVIAHRGPDGEGTHIEGPIALGHRRLAILDIGPGGAQPMSCGSERFWITFNGEIFNFVEIRKTLIGFGHSFRGDSDTEVVLAAYAQWGKECLRRFNGMWAFAIWDRSEKVLFLARDRFGIKPLYYCVLDGRLAFASEMKAFLALPWFRSEFSPAVMSRSIANPYGLEGTEHCILQDLVRVPPGHHVTTRPGARCETTRWWNTVDNLDRVPAGFDEQAEQFRAIFDEATCLRMRSDVPIAFALSGGLDSSSVVCAAAHSTALSDLERVSSDWRRAFVATYPGTRSDERPFAESVVEESGVAANFVDIDPGSVPGFLDELVYHCEEPQSPHAGPWTLYGEMRRAGLKVSLEGHGGDELLAGYVSQIRWALDAALTKTFDFRRAAALSAVLHRITTGLPGAQVDVRDYFRVMRLLAGKAAGRAKAAARVRNEEHSRSLHSGWFRTPPMEVAPPELRLPEAGGLEGILPCLYADLHDRVLPTILRDFDRYSMAHGVEVRSPFLDWRLVTFCFSLPESSILGQGVTKRILREAMRGVLPEPVRTRNLKVPYKSPLTEWWRGPLKELVLDTVSSRHFLESDIWNGERVREHVMRHRHDEVLAGAFLLFRFITAFRLVHLFGDRRNQLLGQG
jgi:asparagine synthase (glutamine-hydrolysing)